MNYRYILTLSFLLITVTASARAEPNEIWKFGSDSGNGGLVVFTTPETAGGLSTGAFESLTAFFAETPPKTRVWLVRTHNDEATLPIDLETDYPSGTNALIRLLSAEESVAIVLLRDGDGKRAVIQNGVRGETSPAWILQAATRAFTASGVPWDLAEYRMPLYRLGWKGEDPLLAAYLRAGLPAIAVKARGDVAEPLAKIAESLSGGIPDTIDRHYLAYRAGNRLLVLGEALMVICMIAASALILVVLVVFGFLFGKKSESRLRDFLRVWWLPFVYLAANALFLYAGGNIASAILESRFGSPEAWRLMPGIALGAKLAIAFFFVALVVSLNQFIHFPEDSFIYGYIASVMCLVNIFVFSSLDFSLSVLFLFAYAISFAAYHVGAPALQVVALALFSIPFVPYAVALFSGGEASMGSPYLGDELWNLRLAFFAMPFQLMVSRFYHAVASFGKRRRLCLPMRPIAALAVALIAVAILLFYPAWSAQNPLKARIRQTIDGASSNVEIVAPTSNESLSIVSDRSIATFPDLAETGEALIGVETASRHSLERQLVTVSVRPMVAARKIEMTVVSDRGSPIYDASTPFELSSSGTEGKLVSGNDPESPWVVSFSSDLDAALTITVRAWTRTNPWGYRARGNDVSADYLLDVSRTVEIRGSSPARRAPKPVVASETGAP